MFHIYMKKFQKLNSIIYPSNILKLNFFNEDDFQNILKQSDIKFPSFNNDVQLVDHLKNQVI